MEYAINLNAVLPVRALSSETSEMITQLLFGEFFEVYETENSFARIKNHFDEYSGWVDKKMVTIISEDNYLSLKNQPLFRICVPIADIFSLTDKTIYRLSAGSVLPFYNPDSSCFGIEDAQFQIHPSYVTYLPESNIDGVVPMALHFLNTPYLWGGKNILGIDCSGFVQVVFSLNGISLPRDARIQVNEGKSISFEDIQSGDLMFFEKEGKITHVGIYIGNNKIIHASGRVKIDSVDNKGILSTDKISYTHILSEIRHFR